MNVAGVAADVSALEDLNAIYFATAKQLILKDRCSAKLALGLSDEVIDVIDRMTPSQVSAVCKSKIPQFRLFISAENLENAAKAHISHAAQAWMFLSREPYHANA